MHPSRVHIKIELGGSCNEGKVLFDFRNLDNKTPTILKRLLEDTTRA